MRCPFCDAPMTPLVVGLWKCPGNGPLLVEGSPCPLKDEAMSRNEIDRTAISLLDAESE